MYYADLSAFLAQILNINRNIRDIPFNSSYSMTLRARIVKWFNAFFEFKIRSRKMPADSKPGKRFPLLMRCHCRWHCCGRGYIQNPVYCRGQRRKRRDAASFWLAGGAVSLIAPFVMRNWQVPIPCGGDYYYLQRALALRRRFFLPGAYCRDPNRINRHVAFLIGDYASEVFRLGLIHILYAALPLFSHGC